MIKTTYLLDFPDIIKARKNTNFKYSYKTIDIFINIQYLEKKYIGYLEAYQKKKKLCQAKVKPKTLKSDLIKDLTHSINKIKSKYWNKEDFASIEKAKDLDLYVYKTNKDRINSIFWQESYSEVDKDFLEFLVLADKTDIRKAIKDNYVHATFNRKHLSKMSKDEENIIFNNYFQKIQPLLKKETKLKINILSELFPLSINNKTNFNKIYKELYKHITPKRFLTLYQKMRKPKTVFDLGAVYDFLLGNVFKYKDVSKDDYHYPYWQVSFLFFYHISEKYGLQNYDLTEAQFRLLDNISKKILKHWLDIKIVGTKKTELKEAIVGKSLQILKKYENYSSLEIQKEKSVIIKELNYYVEKYNNTVQKSINKIKTKVFNKVSYKERYAESYEYIEKNIKKGNINFYHYWVRTYPEKLELYTLIENEYKEGKEWFFKFFKGEPISEEDYKKAQLRKKQTIIAFKKYLLKIKEIADDAFSLQLKTLHSISEELLSYNNNLELKKIILDFHEKNLTPLIENNTLLSTNYKNIFDSYLKKIS